MVISRTCIIAIGEQSALNSHGKPSSIADHVSAHSCLSTANRLACASAVRTSRSACESAASSSLSASISASSRFDQRIVVQPSDQRDLVRHFGERECALLGIGYALHLNLRPDDLAIILDQQ